jgi:hypothetical protein
MYVSLLEAFSPFGLRTEDSDQAVEALTADSTVITADSTVITADQTVYDPDELI